MTEIIDKTNLFQAKKNLQDFLNEHPELKPLQEEIEKALAKSGSQNNRLSLIQTMMLKSLQDLQVELEKLSTSFDK